MKWLAFAVALAIVYPLALLVRERPRVVELMVLSLGLLPFSDVHINLVSFEHYRGDSRGLEITIVDIVIAVLALALPPAREKSPYRLARFLYFLAALISIGEAPNQFFATFSMWKLLRMYQALTVATRACESPRLCAALVKGLAISVIYQTVLCLDQRYHQGLMRVSGNLSHPNSLGMAVNLLYPTAFALLLAGQGGKLAKATVAAGGVAIILSLSRGAIAMFAMAGVIVYLGSLYRKATPRKIGIAVMAVTGAAILVIKAFDTLVERFTSAPASSEEARVRFEAAARLMLADHPWGVGINQFSYVLAERGYADKIGIPPVDRDGIVHNIYWLTAAETGYMGFLSYALLLAIPLTLALHGAMRFKKDIRGDVLLGCAGGLIATYIQNKAEWIMRQTVMSYLFFFMLAIIVAMWRQGRDVARRASYA